MQHVGEPWVSVQMWADPLISARLFNIKHSGSWQELRAEPASTLTSWSELCLWILLPLGTQWLHWDLPGCGNLQARAGQQQWTLVKRRNWGKNLVPFSGKGALSSIPNQFFLNLERPGWREAMTFLCKPFPWHFCFAFYLVMLVMFFSSCILCISFSFDLPVYLLKICKFTEE